MCNHESATQATIHAAVLKQAVFEADGNEVLDRARCVARTIVKQVRQVTEYLLTEEQPAAGPVGNDVAGLKPG